MFGVERGVGRRSEDRKVSNNRVRAYHTDRRLIPRIKEYLGQFRKGYKPDVEELVNYLQTKFHEYSRKKQKAFKTTVQRAYQVIWKQTEEEEHLQELEERFLHLRRNLSDLRNLGDGGDHPDNERGIKKPLESSSGGELSLEDQPPVEPEQSQKQTNLMNESMHEMYKLRSLQPGDEQGAEQAKDPITSGEELKDNIPPQASQPGITPNQMPALETPFPPQLTGSSYSARSHLETSNATAYRVERLTKKGPDVGVKRKRISLTVERKKIPVSVQSRKRQQHSQTGSGSKNDKEKPQDDPEFLPIHSSVRFSDIGGCEKTLEQVCKLLVHMRHPEVFQTLGIAPPRGFLLHGPPGCGKTLLAHAIAGELEMPFIKIAATEIVSGVSGESEEKVRELFSRAVAHSPCVLFLDEIDSITPKRETASKDMERRIVSQLLTCMDDLNSNSDVQVLLIGATNRPDSLDPALRRAGRFDQEISMGIPDEKARERILRVLCNKLKLEENFSFAALAHLAPGFVGADLMALTREAALVAVNRVFQDLQKNATNNSEIDKCSGQENTHGEGKGIKEANKTTGTFSVIEWIRGISPLGTAELEKLCIRMEDFKEALAIVQPSAKREGFATIPDVTWADVGALTDAREELSMAILAPVKYPAEFQALGLTHPPGILLAGPPGCGKTLLAKAIANESGINFISVKGPELLNMYVGESERAVRQVFQRARNSAPCVIFFDELDALCPRRSGSAESSASARVVNQLLTEMDGLVSRKQVFIMAATNRPDIIDPAVMRPGRLDKVLYLGLPTSEDREDILRTLTRDGQKPHLLPDVSIKELALDERCNGFSGADLAALVREACMAALHECINVQSACSVSLENQLPVTQAPVGVGQRHFVAAFEKVKPSVSQTDRLMYEQMKHLSTKI